MVNKRSTREDLREVNRAFEDVKAKAIIAVARRHRFPLKPFALWCAMHCDDANTEEEITAKVRLMRAMDKCQRKLDEWWLTVGRQMLQKAEHGVYLRMEERKHEQQI